MHVLIGKQALLEATRKRQRGRAVAQEIQRRTDSGLPSTFTALREQPRLALERNVESAKMLPTKRAEQSLIRIINDWIKVKGAAEKTEI